MYYKTSFEGDFALDFLNEHQIENLAAYVENNELMKEAVKVDRNMGVIYFSGKIDNEDELIERLLLSIAPFTPDNFTATIVAKGETISDRRDLIMKEKWLYVLSYDLVPGECLRYNS